MRKYTESEMKNLGNRFIWSRAGLKVVGYGPDGTAVFEDEVGDRFICHVHLRIAPLGMPVRLSDMCPG
jgi:hypothetical protein